MHADHADHIRKGIVLSVWMITKNCRKKPLSLPGPPQHTQKHPPLPPSLSQSQNALPSTSAFCVLVIQLKRISSHLSNVPGQEPINSLMCNGFHPQLFLSVAEAPAGLLSVAVSGLLKICERLPQRGQVTSSTRAFRMKELRL